MRKLAGLGVFAAAVLGSTALAQSAEMFNRVASFPVLANLPEGADAKQGTSAEIIAASEDGNTLVYTNSLSGLVGLINITDANAPKALGSVDVKGEPTSVKVAGGKAYVGVVTSKDKTKPAGNLTVVDIPAKTASVACDLAGQPDSVMISPDKTFIAIAMENERDEEMNDGAIPQMPAGNLTIIPLKDGAPDCAALKMVDLTGIAAVAPEDPEPEFVDINAANKAVVTLQENNHIAVVDLASGKIEAQFAAGTADLAGIDTKKDGRIDLSKSETGVLREPDAVRWIDASRFVTANEGDYKGGSRGFTIYNVSGKVEFDSGSSLEHEIVSLGHYPEKRNKKGIEPEGIEVGKYGADSLIFVGAERSSTVSVYRDKGEGEPPEYLQTLPSGVGPEGLLAIPGRNLLVTANETDQVEDGGPRSHVMIFARSDAAAAYPAIRSASKGAGTLPWGALSGLAADAKEPGKLYAVTDSIYGSAPRILTIDATQKPALITGAINVTRDGKPAEKLDLEGVAVAKDGGFWLASEGNLEKEYHNLLIRADTQGRIVEEIVLPAEFEAKSVRFGYEGVTVMGEGADETVWLAVQREWKDDPKGMAKLLAYKPADKSWGAVRYPLEKAGEGWVGLSEITDLGNGRVAVIERDNLVGDKAKLKKIYSVSLEGVVPGAIGGELPVVKKTELKDLLPELKAAHGYVLDKLEGFTVDAAGDAYAVTDNDGVDGSSGETQFFGLGKLATN